MGLNSGLKGLNIHFIYSFGMCRMWWFLAVLRSFFHSSLLCTFSCHPSPPVILPSSLASSCHLFRGLPLNLVVPKFIYNTLLVVLFSSILCTCPNQRNLDILLTVHLSIVYFSLFPTRYTILFRLRTVSTILFPLHVSGLTGPSSGGLNCTCSLWNSPPE